MPQLPGIPGTIEELYADIERGRVYRLADAYFKFLFGKPERADIFLDLINSIVFPERDRAFTKVEFADREISPARINGKGSRLDIVGTLDNGGLVNLEVQVSNDGDFIKRAVYYWSLIHGGQLDSGEGYAGINRTICINILGFHLLKKEKAFRNSYSIRNDESNAPLNDDLTIYFIELPKYLAAMEAGRKPINSLEKWLCYLAGLEGREMSSIAQTESKIEKAMKLEELFLHNKQERLAYIMEWKAMMDKKNREYNLEKNAVARGMAKGMAKGMAEGMEKGMEKGIAEGMEKGIAEGMEKGMVEGVEKVAKNMLMRGMPDGTIADTTGLSLARIKELKREA